MTHLVPFRLRFEQLHRGCARHLAYERGHRGVCLRVPISDLNQALRLPCELLPFGLTWGMCVCVHVSCVAYSFACERDARRSVREGVSEGGWVSGGVGAYWVGEEIT